MASESVLPEELQHSLVSNSSNADLFKGFQLQTTRELDDPNRQMIAEAYRSKWNSLLAKMLPRMGRNETVEEFTSKVRVAVADSMRESIKSGKDPLTGLANKVSMEKGINRMMKDALRTKRNLTVLYFDLDHFKTKVNDVYGHEAGDEVLIVFAQIIKDSMRETDIKGRFSGDEYGLGAFDLTSEFLDVLIHRINDGLKKHSQTRGISDIAVSIGIATYSGTGDSHELVKSHELIHRADVAMSHAKNIRDQRVKFSHWHEGMEMMPHSSR